ncbi:helix-turn-helix protein [compost metagenome]
MVCKNDVTFSYIRTMKDLNRIKVVLAEKKKTQVWLREQLGFSTTTINLWCTNKRQPNVDDLDKIAIALGVDISELLNPTEF